jgi:glycosyl transferase family 25
MEALLASRGLSAEFIEAVDGLQLTEAELARYDRNRALSVYGAEMNRAEIGCCLSHLKVYETMLARGQDVALVLEDDIECDADFADLIRSVVEQSQSPWLVLRLQSTKGSIIEGDRPATAGDRRELMRGRSLSRVRAGVLGGCGYLIRREGAERLLRYGWRPFMPADQMIDRYWENGVDPYVLRPFPVRQSPRIASEIAGRKERLVSGPMATASRRIRRAFDGLAKRLYGFVALDGWRALVPGGGPGEPAFDLNWRAPDSADQGAVV